jgi:hypothetical protein
MQFLMAPIRPTTLRPVIGGFIRGYTMRDANAAAYVAAVEAADSQALEDGVRQAIDNFVLGCKADGIWDAIKASCILAGARTLNGALVPLAGTAPTNFNFVSGDYNRKTGLVGNATNKSLRTGLLASALSNTSHHYFISGSNFETASSPQIQNLGGVYDGSNLSSLFDIVACVPNVTRRECRSGTAGNIAGSSATINSGLISSGSICGTRTAATLLALYQNGIAASVATNSNTPSLPNVAFGIFARNSNNTQVEHTGSRFNFFSAGDGLSAQAVLALHSRVTDLINAFGAAIP